MVRKATEVSGAHTEPGRGEIAFGVKEWTHWKVKRDARVRKMSAHEWCGPQLGWGRRVVGGDATYCLLNATSTSRPRKQRLLPCARHHLGRAGLLQASPSIAIRTILLTSRLIALRRISYPLRVPALVCSSSVASSRLVQRQDASIRAQVPTSLFMNSPPRPCISSPSICADVSRYMSLCARLSAHSVLPRGS